MYITLNAHKFKPYGFFCWSSINMDITRFIQIVNDNLSPIYYSNDPVFRRYRYYSGITPNLTIIL